MDKHEWYETIGKFKLECNILWEEGILVKGALSKDKDYPRWKRVTEIEGR